MKITAPSGATFDLQCSCGGFPIFNEYERWVSPFSGIYPEFSKDERKLLHMVLYCTKCKLMTPAIPVFGNKEFIEKGLVKMWLEGFDKLNYLRNKSKTLWYVDGEDLDVNEGLYIVLSDEEYQSEGLRPGTHFQIEDGLSGNCPVFYESGVDVVDDNGVGYFSTEEKALAFLKDAIEKKKKDLDDKLDELTKELG